MMTVFVQAFIPILLSLFIQLTAAALAQQLFPGLASNASALAGISAAVILVFMLILWKRDRAAGVPRPAGILRSEITYGLPLLCMAAFAVGAAGSLLSGRVMEAAGVYKHFSNETQEQLFQAELWIQILGPGLVVPAAEELTYRVLFYDRLRLQLPRAAAMLAVALLFAAGHGNWIQAIYAFPMSLLLSVCYELCGHPAGPVAMHMGANLISIFVSVYN